MLDLKFIRDNLDTVKAGVAAKRVTVDFDRLIALDEERRGLIVQLDDLRAQKNEANEAIGRLIKEKKDPKETIAAMKDTAARIDALEPHIKAVENQLHEILIFIPNIPHASVPVGAEAQNRIVKTWGEPRTFDFQPQDHVAICERLDIVDFKRATKLSGSNFLLFKGDGARLERALINFMLDYHTAYHGFKEVLPPVVVNTPSMTGTGQLPKMKDDMYKVGEEDLYLIPTAEVPVTNIHRDEVLATDELPIYYTAYTPCFRREAGSYGKDTRGMMRVHQFDKVELVKFVRPETSYDELESLLACAEKILQLLELPYRVLELATGDLSFAAAKCYDIEVHAAAADKWLECSSCSNFEDFQARRANIRFKGGDVAKPAHVHTLNGSGLALPRTVIAILEHYQTSDGRIRVPEVLRPYLNGQEYLG